MSHRGGTSDSGVSWSQKFSELSVGQSAVSVGVNTANDLHKFSLKRISAMRSQESSQVAIVDLAIVVSVNRVEGRVRSVIASRLELVLQGLHVSLQVQLLFHDGKERILDVTGQVVEAAASHRVSVEGDRAEAVILAGQDHLEEILE